MSNSQVDRNLLFGILALQMDFITRDALIAAMNAWVLEKAKPLGQILAEQGALAADAHQLLKAMVGKHLQVHGNDPRQSLAALGPADALRGELTRITDPDVQASLGHVGDDLAGQTTLPPTSENRTGAERYEILRPHAWGGLGEVYVARDRELNREVALKRIQERHAGNADSRMRFLLEAEITGGLEHPGIVPVYGLGMSTDGRPYYAMRFIRGQTLKEAIEKFHSATAQSDSERRIELRQLLNRFIAVCNAIEYAHNCGVVHRDLKPSNIMLGKYGETLVVDWGLAKAMGRRGERASPEEQTLVPSSGTSSSETLPGSAIGTPAFMSPEQSEGRIDEIGPASDVYSLGATLYVLLTGKEPFESSVIGVILAKVQTGDFIPPRTRDRSVPAPLDAICLKAMNLSPMDRYPSCAALASDLEHWLADEPVTAFKESRSTRSARWIKRHRVVAASSAALLLTAFVGLVIGTALLGRANSRIAAEAEERKRQQGLAEEGRQQADEQRRQADQQRALAEDRELAARRYLYTAQINLAQQALDGGRVGRVIELLDGQRPQNGQRDLRGFGWYYLYRLCHSERLSLSGNRGAIASVAISPDGKTLAVAVGGVIELSNLTPLQPQATLVSGSVNSITFSADNKLLASAGEDGIVKLWDVAARRQIAALSGHSNQVYGVAFSRDAQTLVSSSFDGTVKLWNISWRVNAVPPNDGLNALGRIFGVRETNDSHVQLPSTSLRATLTSPRPEPGDRSANLWATRQVVYGVGFAPDGKRVASGGADKVVRIWDVATAKLQSTLVGHRDTITPVAFSPDGTLLASGSDDTTVRLWDPVTGRERFPPLTGHKDWIESLAFSPDGRFLASGSRDNCVRVWSLPPQATPTVSTPAEEAISEWTSFKGHTAQVTALAFTPDGQTLVSGADDGLVKFWDVLKGQEHVTLRGHTGRLYSVAFSPDGSLLASAADDMTVRLWDVATRRLRAVLAGHTSRVSTAAFSPDGKTVATAGWDHVVKLWDVASGRQKGRDLSQAGFINCVAFSPDGATLASCSSSGATMLWDVASGRGTALQEAPGRMESVAFSPDGRLLASTNDDRRVRLWDLASRRQVAALPAATSRGSSVAFSGDGRLLAAGGVDHAVRIWDVATRHERSKLRGHTASVCGVAFSHDGKLLATGSDDATIKLWDVETGADLLTLTGHTTVVESVAFSPDDKTLASASFDQTVKLWNVAAATPDQVRAGDEQALARERQLTLTQKAAQAFLQARQQNDEAWNLATNPDPTLRNIPRAVDLAKQATQTSPFSGSFWNTLGVAQYRNGDWKAAIAALEKSTRIPSGNEALDGYFLAMAHWQLGDKALAGKYYDQAVAWTNKNRPNDEDLRSARAEAAELLGLKDAATPKTPPANKAAR